MKIEAVIFDLDGTLVDSAPGIFASLSSALNASGLSPSRPLTHDMIGPPLIALLPKLVGTDDASVIEPVAAAFKAHYDTFGYKDTRVYPEVEAMLSRLKQEQFLLFVATNKRKIPTDLIIEWLKWAPYFQGIYSLDSQSPTASSKGALIQHILCTCNLSPESTLYVGDLKEDAVAAKEAGVQFFHASWGYEEAPNIQTSCNGNLNTLISFLENSHC